MGLLILQSCAAESVPQSALAPLSVYKSIALEEHDDEVLTGVSSLEVSPSGDRVLLTDGKSGTAALYDLHGHIRRWFPAPIGFIDSLASQRVVQWLPGHYLNLEESKKLGPAYYSAVRATILNARFLSKDSLLVYGTVVPLLQQTNGAIASKRAFIAIYDTTGSPVSVRFPAEQRPEPIFPSGNMILPVGSEYLLSVANAEAARAKNFSAAATVAVYRSDMSRDSTLLTLPREQQGQLRYNLLMTTGAVDRRYGPVIAYGVVPRLFLPLKEQSITLPALDSNAGLLQSLNLVSDRTTFDSLLLANTRIVVRSIAVDSDGSFVVCYGSRHGDETQEQRMVAWFAPDGTLIRKSSLSAALTGLEKPEATIYSPILHSCVTTAISGEHRMLELLH